MNRLIIPYPSPSRAKAIGKSDADNAIGRLVKYIPAEIISGYTLLSGLVDGASQDSNLRVPAAWGVFILGLLLTPLYLWKTYHPTGVQRWQLLISTISFAVWVYALGGPFKLGDPIIPGLPYEGWFAALLAGAFSWGIAFVWTPVESHPPGVSTSLSDPEEKVPPGNAETKPKN